MFAEDMVSKKARIESRFTLRTTLVLIMREHRFLGMIAGARAMRAVVVLYDRAILPAIACCPTWACHEGFAGSRLSSMARIRASAELGLLKIFKPSKAKPRSEGSRPV